MKNSTITYIALICISIIIPLIAIQNLNYLDHWVPFAFIGAIGISILTIIAAFFKDQTSKHLVVPILSIFIVLFALFNLFFGTAVLLFNPRFEFIAGAIIPLINVCFQIGLLILAIKHVLPQKIEDNELETFETIEI